MKARDRKQLKAKDVSELKDLLAQRRSHLRDLRFRLAGAQLKSVHEISQTRREIATILTAIKEKKN